MQPDFEFITRHRIYTDPADRFLFELDEYKRGEDQLLVAHIRFFKFVPSALKSARSHWHLFRSCVTAPLVCWGEEQDAKWERFVTLFGFKPMGQSILCNNGERRELFIHIVSHECIDRHPIKTDTRHED